MTHKSRPSPAGNQLLAALAPRAYRRLAADLEPANLNAGDVLCEPGEPMRSAYFPDSGLISILVPLNGDRVAEVAVVGREGMIGLSLLFGVDTHPHRVVVHAPGSALRLPAKPLQSIMRRRPVLLEPLLRYADAYLVQISLSAVCNCLHPVPKRYCRWLLMAHDRLGSDRLPLTLKFLALMLTVRLASISEATGTLERAGLIRYRRGELHILDRPGLEAAACGCYRQIQDYFARMPSTDAAATKGQRRSGPAPH